MSRNERLRRVVILCLSFARNLAYYRVGRSAQHVRLQKESHPAFTFWRAVSGNFIDMCVLEWCKLFADKNGKHYWRKIVTDAESFRIQLLAYVGTDEAGFQTEIDTMLRYRDKFIAHLDSDPVMFIPSLEIARKAAWFYYAYLLSHEDTSLAALAPDLDHGYSMAEKEAGRVYLKAAVR